MFILKIGIRFEMQTTIFYALQALSDYYFIQNYDNALYSQIQDFRNTIEQSRRSFFGPSLSHVIENRNINQSVTEPLDIAILKQAKEKAIEILQSVVVKDEATFLKARRALFVSLIALNGRRPEEVSCSCLILYF